MTGVVFLFQIQSFIQQILEGVGHIHSMNILHLDIKVSALLLSALHYLLWDLFSRSLFFMFLPFSLKTSSWFIPQETRSKSVTLASARK